MTSLEIVILIGNAGAGKTWVGETLARVAGLKFLDAERMLLSRCQTTEDFLQDKSEALLWFEQRVQDSASLGRHTVVFEAGAFSQQDTIRRLQAEFCTVLILVEAPLEVRLKRIRGRAAGRHLTDVAEDAVRYDEVFDRELKPKFDFALELQNDDLSEESVVTLFNDMLVGKGLQVLRKGALDV